MRIYNFLKTHKIRYQDAESFFVDALKVKTYY